MSKGNEISLPMLRPPHSMFTAAWFAIGKKRRQPVNCTNEQIKKRW